MEPSAVLGVALCIAVFMQTSFCGSPRLRESRQTAPEAVMQTSFCGSPRLRESRQTAPEALRKAECGRHSLLPSGSVDTEPVIPWFAGVYRVNESNHLAPTCGGTLISPHIVLTAAQCVTKSHEGNIQTVSPDKIKVALGKRFREWTTDEPRAVKAEVREIRVPNNYRGEDASYAHDIALIDLKAAVPLNDNLMPACVDWDRTFELSPGELGTLTGWGVTEDGTVSNILFQLQLPYVENSRCISEAPGFFRKKIKSDMFCTTPDKDEMVGHGLGGGGLTYERNDLQYVQGVLSIKIRPSNPPIAFFTNVQDAVLSSWLQDTKRLFDEAHDKPQTSQ